MPIPIAVAAVDRRDNSLATVRTIPEPVGEEHMSESSRRCPLVFDPAGQQLQHFCESILGLLKSMPQERGPLSQVAPNILKCLDNGTRTTAKELRSQIEKWAIATKQLRHLGVSEQMPFPEDICALVEKIESLKRHAITVAEMLERLSTYRQFDQSAILEIATESDISLMLKNPGTTEQTSAATSTAGDPRNSTVDIGDQQVESTTNELMRLFEQAEAKRREKDWTAAEELYSQVLGQDKSFRDAYLYRGRSRFAAGDIARALDDFHLAIRLSSDPLAYRWRGDAFAILGRLTEALDDYDNALRLRPDDFAIGYNRAVVLRQCGQFDRSLKELDRLLKQRAEHGPLYLNRGLIHFERGQLALARQEFQTTLKFAPDCSEAVQKLEETKRILNERRFTSSPRPAAESGPQAKNVTMPNLEDSISSSSAATINSAPSGPSKSCLNDNDTASNLSRMTDTAPDCSIPFECPNCQQTSAIRWDKLQSGKVLSCPSCQQKFSMNGKGQVFKVAQRRNGKWVNESANNEATRAFKSQRNRYIGLIATVLVIILSTVSLRGSAAHSQAMEQRLPEGLEPRAELFARAWLKSDHSLMRRLTDPAQDRLLFNWLRKNSQPSTLKEPTDMELPCTVEITKSTPPISITKVRFETMQTGIRRLPLELTSTWEKRGGIWLFQPNPVFPTQSR